MSQSIKEALITNGYIIHNVKGISMLPLFVEDEDLVKIEKIDTPLNKLDIVLYTRNNESSYILHRILDIKKKYYLICGDNQDTLEKVYPNQIIGKVTGYYKKGRFVSIDDKEYVDYVSNLELDLNKRIHLTNINKDIKDLLKLISSVINNTSIDQTDFNYSNIYRYASRQNIIPFIFKAIDKNVCPNDIYDKCVNSFNKNLRKTILFENENKVVYSALKNNKIKYLPIKGENINKLYKEYGTRHFSDTDVYIGKDNNIKQVMNDIGYSLRYNTLVELVFVKNNMFNYEMHQVLFSDEYPYASYFNSIFDNAIKIDEYEYKLSNEDFYTYFIAHFHKHDSMSGTGIRFYIDLYYILNGIELDKDKLDKLLKKLGLYEFNNKVVSLMNSILINNEYPIVELNRIFRGNTYGSKDTYIEEGIRTKGKFRYFMDRVFPSADKLSGSRPYLKKYPYFVVVVWIYRIVNPDGWKRIRNEVKHLVK